MKQVCTILLLSVACLTSSIARADSKATADATWLTGYVLLYEPELDHLLDVIDLLNLHSEVDVYEGEVPNITASHFEIPVSNVIGGSKAAPETQEYTLIYYLGSKATGPPFCEIYVHSGFNLGGDKATPW